MAERPGGSSFPFCSTSMHLSLSCPGETKGVLAERVAADGQWRHGLKKVVWQEACRYVTVPWAMCCDHQATLLQLQPRNREKHQLQSLRTPQEVSVLGKKKKKTGRKNVLHLGFTVANGRLETKQECHRRLLSRAAGTFWL